MSRKEEEEDFGEGGLRISSMNLIHISYLFSISMESSVPIFFSVDHLPFLIPSGIYRTPFLSSETHPRLLYLSSDDFFFSLFFLHTHN